MVIAPICTRTNWTSRHYFGHFSYVLWSDGRKREKVPTIIKVHFLQRQVLSDLIQIFLKIFFSFAIWQIKNSLYLNFHVTKRTLNQQKLAYFCCPKSNDFESYKNNIMQNTAWIMNWIYLVCGLPLLETPSSMWLIFVCVELQKNLQRQRSLTSANFCPVYTMGS